MLGKIYTNEDGISVKDLICDKCGKRLPIEYSRIRCKGIMHEINRETGWRFVSHINDKGKQVCNENYCPECCSEMDTEDSKKKRYEDYLQSEHWQYTRQMKLDRTGNKCQLCHKESEDIHVHHLTYETKWCEQMEDLLTVCGDCHKMIHGIIDERKRYDKLRKMFGESLALEED